MITNFGVFCKKCMEKSKPHIVWHEQRAFTFICYNCETIELCKLEMESPPLDIEEYDAVQQVLQQKTSKNTDKEIEKKIN